MNGRAVSMGAVLAIMAAGSTAAAGPREALIEARTRAYDANFRNDQTGLRQSIGEFVKLTGDAQLGPLAAYYASWTEWSLAASQWEARDLPGVIASLDGAVKHARLAVEKRPDLADFHAMLASAMISLSFVDRTRAQALNEELPAVRRKALALGSANPRVVLMDAMQQSYTPPAAGGDPGKAVERWVEAIRLFEAEARQPAGDAAMPAWGRELAYGWICLAYLQLTPPALDKARENAAIALALRPDFWYVRERVLPRLKP